MRRKQTQDRAIVVKKGYAEKRRKVWVRGHGQALEKVVELRVVRGYRKGVSIVSEEEKGNEEGQRRRAPGTPGRGARGIGYRKTRRRVELGYEKEGIPRRQELQRRSKPSRPMMVTAKERWGRSPKGDGGTMRRETTAGRKTREEARQQELGGRRRLWVR